VDRLLLKHWDAGFEVPFRMTEGNVGMHELGIALQIVKIAQGAIPDGLEGVRVERVHLNIGKLSAVVPDSLRFCFGVATRKTRLEGAELVINEIPAMARCRECGHEWITDGFVFNCPSCQCTGINMISGRELAVESIEVKD
jgi:hydrogenase nickel incorporation protein HypA/HybF